MGRRDYSIDISVKISCRLLVAIAVNLSVSTSSVGPKNGPGVELHITYALSVHGLEQGSRHLGICRIPKVGGHHGICLESQDTSELARLPSPDGDVRIVEVQTIN